MKLPGIDYERPVQSLGRENVRGPLRVAGAEAALAEKRVSVAGRVAGNMSAIGRIHQGTAREIAGAQRANISRTNQFSRDLGRMVGAGASLTVNIIKADVARDIAEYERKQRELMEGMAGEGAAKTMQVQRDPHDPLQGMKTVSMATDLPAAFKKELGKLNEQTIKNANWMARPMLEEQLGFKSADAEFEIQKMSNAWQKDFSAGQAMESINDAVLREDWTAARQLHSEFRGLFSGAKNATIAKTLDSAQYQSDQDNISFDSANSIMKANQGFSAQMKAAEKIKNKDIRQGAIRIIQRHEDTRAYSETQGKKWAAEQVEKNLLHMIQNVPPNEWTHNENENSSQHLAIESLKQKHILGIAAETVPSTYRKYIMMDGKALGAADILSDVDKLSSSDYKKFMGMKAAVLQGEEPKALKHAQLVDVDMKRAFGGMGLEDFHKSDPEEYAAMFQLVQKEMADYEELSGKTMTDVEQAGIFKRVMGEYTDRKGWDTSYSIAEDIDAEKINPLADFLRDSKQPVTTENMIRARDQYEEYRPDYKKFFDNMSMNYTEDDLVNMFEEDTYLRQIIASEGKEITSKSRKSYYQQYMMELQNIDAALYSIGKQPTTNNRMELFSRGRR